MGVDSSVAPYVAEFLGTYLLVFTVGCNVLSGSPVWGVTSIACVLMVLIYALAGVSGANFNPAVSVALGLSQKQSWEKVAIYCGVQVVAGILAALSYGALYFKVFNLAPKPGFSWFEAMLAEVLYTCMLCFVVLNTAGTSKNGGNQFFGLAIAFCVIAGGYGAGAVSGGCFNPAVALGIDVSSAGVGFGWGFAYAGYEIIGAALAAGLFRVCRPDEFEGNTEYGLSTKLFSEFLGTFFLVLTVGLNVLGKSPAPVWSIGSSLMCMIYALGSCSGAHFNPAVTLAILVSGRDGISGKDAAAYMGIQTLGGICGAYTYSIMHHGVTFAIKPGKGFDWSQTAVAEIVFTFVLCFVVLCVATVKEPSKDMFGLAIGSCVTAGGYAIGAVSGGSLNPAVSFGVSYVNVFTSGGVFDHCLLYIAYELCGAGLAAGVFRLTHPSEYKSVDL